MWPKWIPTLANLEGSPGTWVGLVAYQGRSLWFGLLFTLMAGSQVVAGRFEPLYASSILVGLGLGILTGFVTARRVASKCRGFKIYRRQMSRTFVAGGIAFAVLLWLAIMIVSLLVLFSVSFAFAYASMASVLSLPLGTLLFERWTRTRLSIRGVPSIRWPKWIEYWSQPFDDRSGASAA